MHTGGQAGLQADNPQADLQAHVQLLAVKRLADVVVGSPFQPGNDIVASALGRQQDDVGRFRTAQAAGLPAQFQAVHAGHHPIEDRQARGSSRWRMSHAALPSAMAMTW